MKWLLLSCVLFTCSESLKLQHATAKPMPEPASARLATLRAKIDSPVKQKQQNSFGELDANEAKLEADDYDSIADHGSEHGNGGPEFDTAVTDLDPDQAQANQYQAQDAAHNPNPLETEHVDESANPADTAVVVNKEKTDADAGNGGDAPAPADADEDADEKKEGEDADMDDGEEADDVPVKEMPTKEAMALVAKVLSGYNAAIRPNDGGEALNVTAALFINAIPSIDQKNQQFTVVGDIRLFWTDPRLVINGPTDFTLDLTPQLSKVWRPKTYVVNSMRTTVMQESLLLYSGGRVYWQRRVLVTALCMLDFTELPFDKQVCGIDVGLFNSPNDEVVIIPKAEPMRASKSLENTEWDIPVPKFSVEERVHERRGLSFSSVVFHITFARRSSYWLYSVIGPCIMFTFIATINFWVDAEKAPARAGLGVIAVLIMVNEEASVMKSLPPISYTTWLSRYIHACSIFIGCVMVEFAVTQFMLENKKRPAQDVAGKGCWDKFCAYFRSFKDNQRLDMHCRWVFPAVFLLYNVYMFSTHPTHKLFDFVAGH